MAYYFLISSLPMLQPDKDMPLSYDQFLEMCRTTLKDEKYQSLKNLTLSSNGGPLISQWAKIHQDLKEELTYQRNLRLGRKVKAPDQRDEKISKIVSAAMNNNNPLSAEESLLEFQFEKLDELIGIHYFDEYALMGYALKLKLLEQKYGFKKELGKAEFNRIIEKLEQQILRME